MPYALATGIARATSSASSSSRTWPVFRNTSATRSHWVFVMADVSADALQRLRRKWKRIAYAIVRRGSEGT